MNSINFKSFFELVDDQLYAVVKLDPQFPSITQGQDIDIFCRDVQEMARRTIYFLSASVDSDISISVTKKHGFVHVDLMKGRDLYFRFDLIGMLPKYSNIDIKESLFDVVIESSVMKDVGGFCIKVPNATDEAVLRYIEYLEYISSRPDKIKHAFWIKEQCSYNSEFKEAFLLRLHHFIAIPEPVYAKKSYLNRCFEDATYFKNLILTAYNVLRNDGFYELYNKLLRRFQ